MADWILVPCLVSLRGEFNSLAPERDRASDGSIGDEAHASSSSDHNPDETGTTPYEDADNINEVHAIDVDIDLRKPGWTMQRAVQIIVTRHRQGRDDRLQNVIYNRVIWSRSWGWTAREYTGSNPHDKHAHFSSRYTTHEESSTSPWGLLEEDDMPSADEIADAVWTRKPWASSAPISAADGVQQAAKADDALAEVRALREVVEAQGAQLTAQGQQLAEILRRLPAQG